ncbi:hypothetical protein BGZ73_006067 [Actinomortierella ambigua]|nr:hypothetical protein BGZ73_006067 [Actinomortierella ambigua]
MPLTTGSRNSPSPRSDGKRNFRRRTRKNWSQRDNIENAVNTTLTSMAHLPVQKQSTRIRKRLDAEGGDPSLTHCHSNGAKVQRAISADIPVRSAASPLLASTRPKVATLQRTLSDKSSFLNQAASLNDIPSSPLLLPSAVDPLQKPVSPLSAKPHCSTTPTSVSLFAVDSRKRARSAVGGTEGHDADDENDLSHLRFTGVTKRARSMGTHSLAASGVTPPVRAADSRQSEGVILAPLPRSTAMPVILVAEGNDDIFGSDTTLTSYEDSDDEVSLSGSQAACSDDRTECHRALPCQTPLPPPVTLAHYCHPDIEADLDQTAAVGEHDRTDDPETECIEEPPFIASLLPEDFVIRRGTTAPALVTALSSNEPRPLMSMVLDKRDSVDSEPNEEDAFPKHSVQVDNDNTTPSFEPILSLDEATPSTPPPKSEFAVPSVPLHRLLPTSSPPAPVTSETLESVIHSTVNVENSVFSPISDELVSDVKAHRSQPMYRTCLEIMLERSSVSIVPNVLLLKTILRHKLLNGMRTVNAATATKKAAAPADEDPTDESLELDPWGQVIGNGRGLFKETEKARAVRSRIDFRRNLVQKAFAKFDRSTPADWDKSSALLISTLNKVETVNVPEELLSTIPYHGSGRGLWSTSLQGLISQLALPRSYTCDDCNRSFRVVSDLSSHQNVCTMRAIHVGDHGESTTSEPEENRQNLRSQMVTRQYARQNEGDDDLETIGEIEEGIIRCVCESTEDEGSMIQCDKCYVWLHLECVGLDSDHVPDEYYCPTCLGLPVPRSSRRSARASRTHRRKIEAPIPKMPRFGRFSTDHSTSDKENDGALAPPSLNGVEATSPQVVLNHDWDDEVDLTSSDLGYDHEYMASLWGISARPVFKQRRAPALMLDGSSNLDSDLGLDSLIPTHVHLQSHPEIQGLDPISESQPVLHDSNTFNYLPADGAFESSTLSSDGFAPELLLPSEDTIESEGLRTPVDYSRDDIWEHNDLDDLDDVYGSQFNLQLNRSIHASHKRVGRVPLEEHFPRELLTDNVIDWFFEQNASSTEDLDLDGIIDLGTETAMDE